MSENKELTKRFIASILIEAETPLKTGSGDSDLVIDSPVLRDYNDLPMILGTSITGALRSIYRDFGNRDDELFGSQDGEGSKIIISNAHLVDENGEAVELLLSKKSDFLKMFDTLPVREHVKITHKGVAKEHGKFDDEVCYKGTRWRFEIELIGDKSDSIEWERILNILTLPTFRLGGSSRKGYGKIKVVEIKSDIFDVLDERYINKSSSLNDSFGKDFKLNSTLKMAFDTYTLKVKPDSFFMFGSGFGDDEADMTPLKEPIILWQEMKFLKMDNDYIVAPASSIKGALSHRTAFYYNKLNKIWAEDVVPLGEAHLHTEKNNEAVKNLFGYEKSREDSGLRGRVLISDLYIKNYQEKVFDHVKIDRFRGGAKEGALFQEKVVTTDDELEIEIILEQLNKLDKNYIQAFEMALKDLATGMLPLGGSVNRGHGVFVGKVYKNGEELKDATTK